MISRLGIGTAQLCQPYGLTAATASASQGRGIEILETALALGIDYFDTAPAYGDAEWLLGQVVRQQPRQSLRIATKLNRHDVAGPRWKESILDSVERSGARLGVETIDQLLVHDPMWFFEHSHKLADVLNEARQRGLIREFGVSIYDIVDPESVARQGASVVQFPCNAFDQRFLQRHESASSDASHMSWVARSALLQGLLLLSPQEGESRVPGAEEPLGRWHSLCERYFLTPLDAALGWCRHRSSADYVVVGVDQATSVREVVRSWSQSMPDGFLDDVTTLFSKVPRIVSDPRVWVCT